MTQHEHQRLRGRIAASAASIAWNFAAQPLIEEAVGAGEGRLTTSGALSVTTAPHTGRSPQDKFIVDEDATHDRVWWATNTPMRPEAFERLLDDAIDAVSRRRLHAQTLFAGADPRHRFEVTIFTETAWHALFIRNLLIREVSLGPAEPVTILHVPSLAAEPAYHGTRSERVIALDMRRNIVVIGGTAYAGEIKKSVFSLFNFHAPADDVLPMHCSANVGRDGHTALFFGLSGTGKTTLSNDPARLLIGDDEHGWTADGVFNLEGGCYAKTVKLRASSEPEIFAAAQSPGTVLENLVIGEDGVPDFDDVTLTENTRAAYPLETLPAVARGGVGGVPKTVVFLTADAFGVLPPLARLTTEQAVYHFLSGYTAKVAGTERGVTEPSATFSAFFGAPFMPLHPRVYGRLLEDRLVASGAKVWLLNTGWTGGAHGTGRRIDLATTRRLLNAALSGELETVAMRRDPVFGLAVPVAVEDVDAKVLDPRAAWADPDAYDAAAHRLLTLFERNFERFEPRIAAAQ
jgi:phosphoenolpyruvate carboxykinase (ATP)